MDLFTKMDPLHAAALHLGLLTFLMMLLKAFVGNARGRMKVAPGDVSNPEFARVSRVQQNAVEDVSVLMVGLLALGLLASPTWYVHLVGGLLVVSRILHAVGLARSGGFSLGRLIGTFGTLVVYLLMGAALVRHAFDAAI
ncbi:MAG: MAPEG family protein [Hyphomonadaceae bacterium]